MAEGDTYKAFKARARLEFHGRHAGRAEAVQQRLLRVRLRQFLLTVGAEVDRERRPRATGEGNNSSNDDGDTEAHTFALEQKRLAVAREAAKVKRHRSARVIQKFFRHCQRLMLKDEEELLSTSVLIAMPTTTQDATKAVVAYVNPASAKKNQDDTSIRQERKKPIARRANKTHQSFQRKRALQSSKSEKPEPPVLLLKDSKSSPIGRISRAEALSPPSSPSSIASSEAGEMIDSPSPQRQANPSRRFFPPKHQNYSEPTEISPPKEGQETQTKASSPRAPAKSFLKRKPSKVVFHKLDWSGVSSKTDSNLPTSSSSRANSGAASRASNTSRSARSSPPIRQSSSSDGDDARNTSSPGAFIDVHTAVRLAALESTVYERCCVARETASLARVKYQKERKKFAATLQSQKQRLGSEVDQPTSQESGSKTDDSALTELWKRLTGDSSGALYAATLRNLLERPARPNEPPLSNFNVQP